MRIDNISSIDGRLLLQDIFHNLRFEHQRSAISTLLTLWRICISDTELSQYVKDDVTVMHKLGFLRGTRLWLEEIVNRYYFSSINSFVYFGAAVLLVLIGVNRFSDKVDNSVVIYGLVFEASMLLLMFVIMLFTPNDDVSTLKKDETNDDLDKELLNEIGEISRDFAVTSVQLEKITDHLLSLYERQNELTDILKNIAKMNADAIAPNPQMLEVMKSTNEALAEFKQNIIKLNETTKQLEQEQIQIAVHKEVERFILELKNKN
jgi:hypothetical protein